VKLFRWNSAHTPQRAFRAHRWLMGVFVLLGVSLLAQGFPAPQATLYTRTFSAHAQAWTADNHLSLAQAWQAIGDTPRALPHWEAALAQQPTLALARLLSETYLAQGDGGRALDKARTAYALAPDDAWANAQLGFLLAPFAPTQAQSHWRVVATHANASPDQRDLARALLALGDDVSPQRIGTTFIAHKAWAYAEQAFAYLATQDYPNALATAYIGWVRQNNGKDGTTWTSSAVALAPEDADVRLLQALQLRQAGAHEASIQAFETAIALNPQNPVAYAEFAALYDLLGLTEQAQRLRQDAPP
jgi:tetratricopeptide (TPR) repeat protein